VSCIQFSLCVEHDLGTRLYLAWFDGLTIRTIQKSLYKPRGPIRPERISGLCSMKRLGVFLLPLVGMLVHRSFSPNINFIHLGEKRICVLSKNTTQCPSPGLKLEPKPFDPESCIQTTRPPHLPFDHCESSLSLTNRAFLSLMVLVRSYINMLGAFV